MTNNNVKKTRDFLQKHKKNDNFKKKTYISDSVENNTKIIENYKVIIERQERYIKILKDINNFQKMHKIANVDE